MEKHARSKKTLHCIDVWYSFFCSESKGVWGPLQRFWGSMNPGYINRWLDFFRGNKQNWNFQSREYEALALRLEVPKAF